MTSIQDIWDIPADTVSSHAKPPVTVDDDDDTLASNPKRSTARPHSTLFLDSGSEDEGLTTTKGTHYASKPGSSKPDIDAFWADLDDDPDTGFQELPPSLDVAALKRQTEAELPLTPHQILPSSSPPREDGDGKDAKDRKRGRDGLAQKIKRPTLNEGRILGPEGFPALIKQTKDFKPKGKGHELHDLNRLMTVYQFWSHKMYPNTQFSDTVQRVEKLCHSKRMHVALGVWRDESKGLINGRKVPDPNDADNSDDDDDVARPSDVPIATEDERSSPIPSRGPSVPPSTASEGGLGEDFDIDAMIMEEEAANAFAAESNASGLAATVRAGPEEDEDMWDAVMGDLPDEPVVPRDRQPSVTVRMPDEDEDMWDIVNEMEMTAEANAKPGAPPVEPLEVTQQAAGPVVVGMDPSRKATNDEGWDEMYA